MKNKILSFLPVLLFLVFTFGFCLMFFALPKADFSAYEKRCLAETPDFSARKLLSGELVKEIDGDSEKGTVGYVADHFPFRSFFVGVNSYFNLSYGNTANNDYYFGKDGFILPKPYETHRLGANIGVVGDFAEANDLDVTLAVVPSPGHILGDKLPKNHISYGDKEVYEKLSSSLSDKVNYCDLESVMKEYYEKAEAPYYKTDHHWTTPAAYEAYKALGNSLGYEPTAESVFEKQYHNGFYGTTYSSSGYFLSAPDTLEVWKNPTTEEGIKVEIFEGLSHSEHDTMFFENHLTEPDMYPVFLDGNHAIVKITNPDAEGGSLVVVKDSYAHALVPFLADNYSEIVMVDMRYFKDSISSLCKEHGAEEVLVLYSISNFCTDPGLSFLE